MWRTPTDVQRVSAVVREQVQQVKCCCMHEGSHLAHHARHLTQHQTGVRHTQASKQVLPHQQSVNTSTEQSCQQKCSCMFSAVSTTTSTLVSQQSAYSSSEGVAALSTASTCCQTKEGSPAAAGPRAIRVDPSHTRPWAGRVVLLTSRPPGAGWCLSVLMPAHTAAFRVAVL